MQINLEETFPIDIEEEGTVMDYVDDEFVFIIKDMQWTAFELEALKKQTLQMDFVYKYDIAVFLLTLEDAIDTSDFIFCCHDNDYASSLYKTFDKGTGYACVLYLIDANNVVKGKRRIQLSMIMSNIISSKLKEQREHPYLEAEFSCNLEGMQNAYEPFELQPFALASDCFK